MAMEPDIQELADSVRDTLDRQGTLASLKAQLRAAVTGVLESQKAKTARQWSSQGRHVRLTEKEAMRMIHQTLSFLKLFSSLNVFEAEVDWDTKIESKKQLISGKPVLLDWIEAKESPVSQSPDNIFKESVNCKESVVSEKSVRKALNGDPSPLPPAPLTSLSNLPPLVTNSKPVTTSSLLDPLPPGYKGSVSKTPSPPRQHHQKDEKDSISTEKENDLIEKDDDLLESFNRLKSQPLGMQEMSKFGKEDYDYDQDITEDFSHFIEDSQSEVEESSAKKAEPIIFNSKTDNGVEGKGEEELVTTDRSASPTFLTGLALHDFSEPVEVLQL